MKIFQQNQMIKVALTSMKKTLSTLKLNFFDFKIVVISCNKFKVQILEIESIFSNNLMARIMKNNPQVRIIPTSTNLRSKK